MEYIEARTTFWASLRKEFWGARMADILGSWRARLFVDEVEKKKKRIEKANWCHSTLGFEVQHQCSKLWEVRIAVVQEEY